MKKNISLLICFVLILSVFNVYAYEFPKSFWKINDAYQAAVDSGDDWGIIQFGEETISLM